MAQPIMTNPITDQLNELRDNKAQPCLTVQSCNASPYSFVMKDQLGAQQGPGIVKKSSNYFIAQEQTMCDLWRDYRSDPHLTLLSIMTRSHALYD